LYFNPRARAGRDLSGITCRFLPMDFNPRARAGRDVHFAAHVHLLRISIHAPARGATCERNLTPKFVKISIHAPARGATTITIGQRILTRFQSTRPRGARLRTGRLLITVTDFNPRARAGRDSEGKQKTKEFFSDFHRIAY